MAMRHSWLPTIVIVVLAIHLSVLHVEAGCKDKNKDKKDDYDCCHCYEPCDPCCDPCYYGGRKGRYGHGKYGYGYGYDNCYNDCYDCCHCCKCDDKKKSKKEGKGWKKFMKGNKDKGKDKGKDKCKGKGKDCDCHSDCCGQTVIVKNGPAIIQTIIVDSDVYSKCCKGYYGQNNPLQKVCLQDDCQCYRSPPRYNDCFDPQSFRVVVQDPCHRSCEPPCTPCSPCAPYQGGYY